MEGNERTEARPSHGAAGIEHAAGQGVVRASIVSGNAGTGMHNAVANLLVEDSTVTGNTAGVTALGGDTVVRGSTLTGQRPNLAGLQIDIPSWLTVEDTTLTGGAPNCVITAQVDVRLLGENRADDESCPFPEPAAAPVAVEPVVLAPPAATPPITIVPAPAALRVRRSGSTLLVDVPAAGRLRLTGARVRTVSRRVAAARTVRMRVRTARSRVRINLTFRPDLGATQVRRMTIRLLKHGGGSQ